MSNFKTTFFLCMHRIMRICVSGRVQYSRGRLIIKRIIDGLLSVSSFACPSFVLALADFFVSRILTFLLFSYQKADDQMFVCKF